MNITESAAYCVTDACHGGRAAIPRMSHIIPPPRRPGRPRKPDAFTPAERARRYRQRQAARLAELRDESQPLHSPVIDLSALPAWRRR